MNYIKITSPSNPRIKEALDIKNKRSRYRERAFIIEGPHLVEMALTSGSRIRQAFFTDEFSEKKEGQRLLRLISGQTDEIYNIKDHILDKLADTETPQGILATASCKPKKLDEIMFGESPFIVIVDGVQEPGNLGAIIRTSDAAGADAVIILKGTCDPFMQKAIRATAGSIFNIQIVNSETEALLKWITLNKINLIVTAADAGKSIFEKDLKGALAFVFGNEARGVSAQMRKKADLILRIPILGKAESLNVAVSASICLYEAVRQRQYR